MARVVIIGEKALQARLRAIAIKVPAKVGAALFQEAEEIMTVSKRDHVPVAPDGGTLRGSGFVNPPEFGLGGDISVTLGFGGPAAPYAEAIHEHPSGASPPTWEGKTLDFHLGGDRTKYLERPLLKAVPGMGRRIAKSVGLGGGGGRARDPATGRFI